MSLTYEPAEQDGYSFRAVEVWPADQDPYREDADSAAASDAYHSTLTITRDDQELPGRVHPDA